MIVVATIVVDADDPSLVVNTILKAAKTLKVVELHIEMPQVEESESPEDVQREFIAAEYELPANLAKLVKVSD